MDPTKLDTEKPSANDPGVDQDEVARVNRFIDIEDEEHGVVVTATRERPKNP